MAIEVDLSAVTAPPASNATPSDPPKPGGRGEAGTRPADTRLLALTEAVATIAASATTTGDLSAFGIYNPMFFGGHNDGVHLDDDAIARCIAASTPGSMIFFPPSATVGGGFLISKTIVGKGNRAYEGTLRLGSIIEAAPGSNLRAMFTTESVVDNTVPADEPITMAHLKFDGTRDKQTSGEGHGIEARVFWSRFVDVEVWNVRGSGFRLTTVTQNNAQLTQQGPENKFIDCVVRGSGSHAFHVYDPDPANQSANGLTDCWFVDCIVEGSGGDGIRVDCSAGCFFKGCHLYGVAMHPLHAGQASLVDVSHNYVETWGFATAANWYAAICLGDGVQSFLGAEGGCVVVGNRGFYSHADAPAKGANQIVPILVNVGGGVKANLTIGHNSFKAYGSTGECRNAVWLALSDATSGAVVKRSANRYEGWMTNLGLSANGGTFAIQREEFFTQDVPYAATITPDTSLGEEINVGPLTGRVAVNAPTSCYKGQRVKFSFVEDATGGRAISFSAAYRKNLSFITTAKTRNTIEFVCTDPLTPVLVQTAGAAGL